MEFGSRVNEGNANVIYLIKVKTSFSIALAKGYSYLNAKIKYLCRWFLASDMAKGLVIRKTFLCNV